MLLHQRARAVATALGLGALFFLSASQVGVFVGWCDTTASVIRHAEVDVWVMADHTAALEFGPPIPRHRVDQVRNVPGVAWAESLHWSSSVWRRGDGLCTTVSVVGLDKGCAGGPWALEAGTAEEVHRPDSVIVDEFYLDRLGVAGVGDEAQVFGRRAVVRGISRGVRPFTAMPCVFTSLKTARRFDRRYEDDEITYVVVRTAPGEGPEAVARAIVDRVPHVEALTGPQFARRTTAYWMLRTGAGVTVILMALLGIVIGAVVSGQALFTITQDNRGNYAALLALGFGRAQMLVCVLAQGLLLSGAGIAAGSLALGAARAGSTRTPVPLEMTPPVFVALVVVSALCCLAGAFFSVRAVWRIDPVAVFRG
jgi:putative ABC transport system permease protein